MCGPVEDHAIVGQILNRQERVETYLEYVKEYVDILTDGITMAMAGFWSNGTTRCTIGGVNILPRRPTKKSS